MKIFRLLLALTLLSTSAFGQLIDYRALGPNAFYTNGFIVNSKHWTNSVGTLTTPTNFLIYAPHYARTDVIAHEFDVDILTGAPQTSANSYGLAGFNNLFPNAAAGVMNNISGQVGVAGGAINYNAGVMTNGEAAGVVGQTERAHSLGIGVVGTSFGLATTTNIGVSGSAQGAGTNVGGYFETLSAKSSASRKLSGAALIANNGDTLLPILRGQSNFVDVLVVNTNGDLSLIKGVVYSWPTAYGGANSVLTMPAADGSLVWSNIPALVTNNQARIGPGTNNVIAKFNVVGGTNVGNSPLQSSLTNSVEQRPRADGGDFNVASTNKIVGRETAGGDTNWLEIIAGSGGGSEAHHLRSRATGAANQRLPLYLQDAVVVEPISNQLVGHAVGGLYPLTGSSGAGLQTLGTSALPWIDVWASRLHGTTGLNSGPQFGTGVGGTGFGITTDNTMLQFFRDTGITAAFNKHNISGALILDLAGNGLGFGTGMSNTICGFLTSGITGLVQNSVTNNTSATPGTHGIMGVQGSGTDKGGGDLRFVGGPSTGTGTNGNLRLQTAEKALATSPSLNSSFKDRLFVIADPIILATNTATIVFTYSIPTALKGAGGQVIAHTEIENGVDIATVDETFMVTANRKGSTVVTGISAPVTCTSSSGGSASAVNTWSAVANSTSVDVKLTCVTSGILSTNSTVRVTFIPNSSAVPVITHP